MQTIPSAQQFPNYWQILSDRDRYQYAILRMQLSSQCSKNQRNKRVENFIETIEAIKRFCVRGDGEDWKRFLVCGICWLQEGIAINTRQLRLLIFKCKSSINGSLHKMGFTVNLGRSEAASALVSGIPILKDNINELRQWTVRQTSMPCASPISPPMPSNFVVSKGFEIPMINLTARAPSITMPQLDLPQKQIEISQEIELIRPNVDEFDYNSTFYNAYEAPSLDDELW